MARKSVMHVAYIKSVGAMLWGNEGAVSHEVGCTFNMSMHHSTPDIHTSIAAFFSFATSFIVRVHSPVLFSGSNTLPSFYHVPSGSLYSPGYTPWGHRPSWEQHSTVAVETETKVYTAQNNMHCILGGEKRRGNQIVKPLELHHSSRHGSIAQLPMVH